MLIETLVTSLSLKVGSRLLSAAIKDEGLGRGDAADFASAILEALVSGQQKANEDLARIEQKIDTLTTNPFHASMTAGYRLLRDAAPSYRKLEDRRVMLNQARDHFTAALGHAHGRPIDEARAEVMYGLVWAASGSGIDFARSLERATALLQHEALVSFHMACAAQRDSHSREASPSTRFREAFLGPDMRLPDFSGANRFVVAQQEHEASLALGEMAGLHHRYPRLLRPHGSIYSLPRPGLPIRISRSQTYEVMDVQATLTTLGLKVQNNSSRYVRAAMSKAELGPDGVIVSDMAALDHHGELVPSGQTTHVLGLPLGPNAACISLGRFEGVEVGVLLHDQDDWAIQADRRRQLRS
ncbi:MULTISPECIES: hypothetical protein [unclassified Knoellia]|uniref:hypothetical protein n=1 Tax=Knoellia altitudinis TaxID=3404795 RepID=UPI00361B3C7B